MKNYFSFIWAILFIFGLTSVLPAQESQLKYSKVRIIEDSNHASHSHDDLVHELQEIGIYVDHFHGNGKEGEVFVLDENELFALSQSDIHYEILIDDISQYVERRNKRDLEDPAIQSLMSSRTAGFGLGSMGGFYTWSEMIGKMDEMKTLYPNLITDKFSIGTTIEGREIWAAKISDNPDQDESATETSVYYDAMHHAREPLSMSVSINFMFWLLENYGVNPEATFLVNNRELFFVPIVNPDGYVYNETTNPNGGGLWRKNRRDVVGSSCYGVDLNRNYSFGYGLNSGSSSNPCNNTYRGASAFSEPESQAVRDFVDSIAPPIAFSIHSTAGKYLQAYGYTLDPVDYETYTDFSLDMLEENEYPYGVTGNMLGYTSSGTTRDYLYGDKGIYAWTPEIGGSGFWPAISEIIPRVEENEKPLRYIAWVAGAFPDIKEIELMNNVSLVPTDTAEINVEIFNKGLRESANNILVRIESVNGNVNIITDSISASSIPSRGLGDIANNPLQFIVDGAANYKDEIHLQIIVELDSVEIAREDVRYYVGERLDLFVADAENDMGGFTSSGSGQNWDTSFVDSRSGLRSIADSRYTNSSNNSDNYCALTNSVDLTTASFPVLHFNAKWSLENTFDYVRLQISNNNGSSWNTLTGLYTESVGGSQGYTANQTWIQEVVDLSAYIGDQVLLRFYLHTDGNTPSDGFYFDDFTITDFQCPIGDLTCTDYDMDGVFANTDPNDSLPCIPYDTVAVCDTDMDGVVDGFDCAPLDPSMSLIDSCGICGGDGLTCVDVDADGVFADIDPDDNNPCIPNALSSACDADGDGVFADVDPDDNLPCIPYDTVAVCDTDMDGVADGLDCAPNDNMASTLDSCGICGGDGLSCQDLDMDGVFADVDPDDMNPCDPNPLSSVCDADGDGVFADVDPDDQDPCIPNGIDSDNDGVCDEYDICDGGDDTIDNNNDGIPDACANCPLIDFANSPLISYTQQDEGDVSYLNDYSFILENNAWKALLVNYTITANTVIEFDFKSTEEGEIHEVLFDSNLSLNASPRFRLYGNQNTGNLINDFQYTDFGNWEHFVIPVGQYYTGTRAYLAFSADADQTPSIGNSFFANVKLYEDADGDGACDLICVDLSCLDEDGDGVFADVDPDDSDACNPNNLHLNCCELIVRNTNDIGGGSLIHNITCAESGDTILFDTSIYHQDIELQSENIIIDKDLYLFANPLDSIVVSGANMLETIKISINNTVTIEGLHIISGSAQSGRAIKNEGVLVLKDVTITESIPGLGGDQIWNLNELNIKGFLNIEN